MAEGAFSSPTEDEHASCPEISQKCQDVLLRLVSLDPRELCSEAIVEKCRATRDLRSCGRIVENNLTACHHASLCAECGQRCDVCPICRAPIRRHVPSMRRRLYEECCEAGLINFGTGVLKERDRHLLVDVQRLWSFFDIALEYKLISVICHYVSDVCMDERAVSNNATISLLLDGTVVKDWCKKTLVYTVQSLHNIYSLGTREMRSKVKLMEKISARLRGLSQVLESLEGPDPDSMSAPFVEVQQLIEGTQRVYQHLDMMCWCARHDFLEDIQSSHFSLDDWRSTFTLRKQSAANRVWPQPTQNSEKERNFASSTLFIEDAMWNIGIGKDNDNSDLLESLELQCLRQTSLPSPFRRKEGVNRGHSNVLVPAFSYPPENVRAAVDLIFLETNSDLFLAKKAIFLYYLFDRFWPHHHDRLNRMLDDYIVTFDISRHAMLESLVFFLLDEVTDSALEEACHLLPDVVSSNIHPKVARVLLERQKPCVALDVLRCSKRDGSLRQSESSDSDELPHLQDVVTAVRVRLECGLLTDAYLHQSAYVSGVKARTLNVRSNCVGDKDLKHWSREMECLVKEICEFCIEKKLVAKMIELPWDKHEEKVLLNCLLEQARRDPCSSAGSLLVMFYIMRCRNQEAYLVHKQLATIEKTFLEQCGDREKGEIVKSVCTRRSVLVEKGVELLPQIQQDQLGSESLNQFMLPLTECKEQTVFETFISNQNSSGRVELSEPTTSSSASHDDSSQSLVASQMASTESGWGKYRQSSVFHGKPFRTPSALSDVSSQLAVATLDGNTGQKAYGGLLSPILGKKPLYSTQNNFSPFSNRNMLSSEKNTGDEYQKFLSLSNLMSVDSKGRFDSPSVSSYETLESSLDGERHLVNERLQNGESLKADDSPGTALPLYRWAENGAVERRDPSKNGKMFSSMSRDVKLWPQREMPQTSPNGKRKVQDHLDDYVQNAAADELAIANSLQKQQNGIPSSRLDIKKAYNRRKNGLRWQTEEANCSHLPPVSLSSGRINTFNGL